jgi:cysteine desulfurase
MIDGLSMPLYLDCAATTPLDPRVRAELLRLLDEVGNAGSRTHASGRRARAVVERARDRVAAVVAASRGDVVFTSGATESNNLALMGLARTSTRRRHIVSTAIEHAAVLEPLAALEREGFTVTRIAPGPDGVVDAGAVLEAVRPDTLLVSVMHVNNETGAIQPIESIANGLADDDVYVHVDAAQSFGRLLEPLRHARLDLVSASAHKIGGPQGVGALITRRRRGVRPALQPLAVGGGQERDLRPGTVPVALVGAFGLAAELAAAEAPDRLQRCHAFRDALLAGLAPLAPAVNGALHRSAPYIVNLSLPGIEAEAALDAWEPFVAISTGAACSSHRYTCSHVLSAMGLGGWRAANALRFSWTADSERPDWSALVDAAAPLRQEPVTSGTVELAR